MTLLLCLLCLLLCGCAQEAPVTETAPIVTEPAQLVDTTSSQQAYPDGLQAFPLAHRKIQDIRCLGEELLVFSGTGCTTLTVLNGENLTVQASMTLDFELSAQDPSFQLHQDGFSYYDPTRQKTFVLNHRLQESSHIFLSEAIQGSPILSEDQNTLYYITDTAILAWDQESGIHRTVQELSYESQTLAGLHFGGTTLQCRIQEDNGVLSLFLETATGKRLSFSEGDLSLDTLDNRYYTVQTAASLSLLIFGQADDKPQILYPETQVTSHFYLPQRHAAVTASLGSNDRTTLTYYDLALGTATAMLTLDALENPKAVLSTPGGTVYLLTYHPNLDCHILYRWDPTAPAFATESSVSCTAPYPQVPESLEECQKYAAQLSQEYGISIHVGQDALTVQPWDYTLEAETLPRILMQELSLLEQRLAQFPKTILAQTESHFTELHLSLVREITGSTAPDSLDTATGIQFLDGKEVHVIIAVGQYSQQALYHELYHVMETHILSESAAMDQWNEWNPSGFVYSFQNQPNDGWEAYLTGKSRAFVDAYSMTYPKEDRARVFEYAMLPGNADVFRSETMQTKLTALCQAIRQAYGLKKAETLPWEQYLAYPIYHP